MLGGYLYPRTGVVLGPLTVGALQSLKVRRLIIGVGGITEEGLFNQNSLLVETQKQMLDAADEVILATDSSKFGHSELVPPVRSTAFTSWWLTVIVRPLAGCRAQARDRAGDCGVVVSYSVFSSQSEN